MQGFIAINTAIWHRKNIHIFSDNYIIENGTDKQLIDLFMDCNNSAQKRMIMYLVAYDNIRKFRLLVSTFDFNIRFNSNILMKIAIVNSSIKILGYLLKNGIKKSIDKNIAIKLAAGSSIEVLKMILKYKINISGGFNYPLRYAVYCNLLNNVKLLLDNGANINALNGQPLKIALKYNYEGMASFLLRNGAKINTIEKNFLMDILLGSNLNIIKIILSYGVNLKILGVYELMLIIKNQRSDIIDVIKLLSTYHVDFTIINNYKFINQNYINNNNYIDELVAVGIDPKTLATIMYTTF